MNSLHLIIAASLAAGSVHVNAAPVEPMHGAVEMPVSRQYYCYQQGDYNWPVDGSNIKSPGCKAAYQHVYKKSGNNAQQAVYQFNQWHEVSKNVVDFRNKEAVKKAIPDGQLCSAGNSLAETKAKSTQVNDKSGLDVPADWHVQDWKKDDDNKAHMRYKIMAPHNPSYWEIYVSKPDYNPTQQPLKWDDLELVQEIGDVQPVNGYYEFDVDLKEHTGRRVVYTRWQRDDAAGEGFYNCSDVNIVK